jgi:hypothetical protein
MIVHIHTEAERAEEDGMMREEKEGRRRSGGVGRRKALLRVLYFTLSIARIEHGRSAQSIRLV